MDREVVLLWVIIGVVIGLGIFAAIGTAIDYNDKTNEGCYQVKTGEHWQPMIIGKAVMGMMVDDYEWICPIK